LPLASINRSGQQTQDDYHTVIRLLAGLCLLALLLWNYTNSYSPWFFSPAILTTIGYTIITATLWVLSRYSRLKPSGRQSTQIILDITALSLLLIYGEEITSPLCIIYYLLILNSGLQTTSREFRLSATLSIAGFSSVLYLSSFWNSQLHLGIGLLLGMVLMARLVSRQQHQHKEQPVTTASNTTTPKTPIPQDTETENNQKLLLITHDSADRHLLLNYIDSWNIDVHVCSSAVRGFRELLSAVDQGAGYSTVIVDSLNLDMDPDQFARSLLSDSTLCNIKLLHISPGHANEHKTQLINAGYSRILKTPLDKTILFDALHTTKAHSHNSSNITQLINHYSSKENLRQPSDILLATSDKTEQKHFRTVLEQDGQRVYSVENGSQALDALNTHQFDMVIIDFEMPDIKGGDVIRLYYYTYQNQDWVPFIALVDDATQDILSQCRDTEVNAVLVRPIQEHKLLSTVADIASSRAKQAESTDSSKYHTRSSHTDINKDNGRVLNIQTLTQLEHLSSSNDFLDQLITRFNADMNQLLDTLEHCIEDNLFTEFKDQSHALRDSSCNMGADLLHQLSLQALQINQREFQKQAKQILDELHIAQSKTKYALHNYVMRRNNSATEKE